MPIQQSCASNASLLSSLATVGDMSRRNDETICQFLTGWPDEDKLLAALKEAP